MDDSVWYTRFICLQSELELANARIRELEKLVDDLNKKLAKLEQMP